MLDPDGRRICELLLQNKTEREIATIMGISQQSTNYKKKKASIAGESSCATTSDTAHLLRLPLRGGLRKLFPIFVQTTFSPPLGSGKSKTTSAPSKEVNECIRHRQDPKGAALRTMNLLMFSPQLAIVAMRLARKLTLLAGQSQSKEGGKQMQNERHRHDHRRTGSAAAVINEGKLASRAVQQHEPSPELMPAEPVLTLKRSEQSLRISPARASRLTSASAPEVQHVVRY